MSGWSEGFEGNGSDIGPRWDGVRSGLKMVTDSLPLFLSRRNNSICTYTGLLIALTNKMIQKQCYIIFKAMTEEIYSFYLLLLESRCFALWAFCFVLCEPTRMFPSSGNPPMTGAHLITSCSRKTAQLSSTYRLFQNLRWPWVKVIPLIRVGQILKMTSQ